MASNWQATVHAHHHLSLFCQFTRLFTWHFRLMFQFLKLVHKCAYVNRSSCVQLHLPSAFVCRIIPRAVVGPYRYTYKTWWAQCNYIYNPLQAVYFRIWQTTGSRVAIATEKIILKRRGSCRKWQCYPLPWPYHRKWPGTPSEWDVSWLGLLAGGPLPLVLNWGRTR